MVQLKAIQRNSGFPVGRDNYFSQNRNETLITKEAESLAAKETETEEGCDRWLHVRFCSYFI